MKTLNISLSSIQDLKSFVSATCKCDYEIDLVSDRYVVDAKSIMGIISLDLSKPIEVKIYSDECDEFIDEIKTFIV